MKVTIDSNEPLENALRVLGAMYDVTLDVSTLQSAQPQEPSRSVGDKSAGKTGTASVRSARRKPKRAAKRAQGSRRGSARSVSNAELRSWAKEHGYTVADRGRLPADVVEAYHVAQRA